MAMAQLGAQPEHRASANGPGGRRFGPERKPPVESGPSRMTTGEEWKRRALDWDPSAWEQHPPTDGALSDAAGAPEREPASCNANMGERAAGER